MIDLNGNNGYADKLIGLAMRNITDEKVSTPEQTAALRDVYQDPQSVERMRIYRQLYTDTPLGAQNS